ncbi:MAG TPA: hypothetical protein VN239_04820 [Nitrososphaera sp.]|jgi:hypothetical protein|nr:hypothetical protein [Nitrososphaera sp.]
MKRLDDHPWFSVGSSLGNSNSDKAHAARPLPSRYKTAIVMTGGVIFVLLNIIIPQIRQLTTGLPNLLSTLVGVVII